MTAKKPRKPRQPPPRSERARAAAPKVTEQVPIGVWVRWSGRDHRVLYDQERRHGIPIGRRVIDLPAVARWIHEAIAAGRLRSSEDEGPAGDSSPALERQRAAKAELYELDLAERRGELIQRSEVLRGWTQITEELRSLSQDLEREHGREAHGRVIDAFDRLLTVFGREVNAAAASAQAPVSQDGARDDAAAA